jgi:hypothetical protein
VRPTAESNRGIFTVKLPGCVVRVLNGSPLSPAGLEELYPYHRCPDRPGPDLEFRLHAREERGRITWTIEGKGGEIVGRVPPAQLAEHLEWQITRRVLERQMGTVPIHAAAVACNGGGALLPAGPGAGKTTLALALRKNGVRVLCDDIALAHPRRPSFRAFPRSFRIKIKAGAGPSPQARLTAFPDVQGDPSVTASMEARWILFPERSRATGVELAHCSETESLERLLRMTHGAFSPGARALSALAGLVRTAACRVIRYGEAEEAAAVLAPVLLADDGPGAAALLHG